MGVPEAQPREEMVVKRKGTAFSAVVGEKKMSRKKSRGAPFSSGPRQSFVEAVRAWAVAPSLRSCPESSHHEAFPATLFWKPGHFQGIQP